MVIGLQDLLTRESYSLVSNANHSDEKMFANRISLYELLLLSGLVTALTLGTAWLYPIWDDARLLFLIGELGSGAIQTNFGDRPLAAALFTFLFSHQLFFPIGIVFHWITWLGMGLVTMRLWQLMFPAYSRFALLPALLSIAPVLCKVQLVTFTVVFLPLLGPVLTFLAIFMLLSEQPSLWRRIIVVTGALALIAFSILISQYAVPTAAIAIVFLTAKVFRSRRKERRQVLVITALLVICALGSYLMFCWLTRSTVRQTYEPSYAVQSLSWKMKVIPFRLLSSLWRGAIGGVLESLGAVTLGSKIALLSFVCGAVFSGLVTLAVYKRAAVGSPLSQNRLSVITLLAATVVALMPVLLLDRTPGYDWDSRFWVPMSPILSNLTVFIFLSVLRRRLWLLVPVLCGFLAGYWTTSEIANTIRNRDDVYKGNRCRTSALRFKGHSRNHRLRNL